jgi:hypothetical protein
VPAPTNLQVTQSGPAIGLDWQLPSSPARTGVRIEVGSADGRADLGVIDLPPDQQTFTASAPPGRYFARMRALAGAATSLPTADVSFAVGPPPVPGAPLDVSAVADGASIAFAWQTPSTGAPERYELEVGSTEGGRDLAAVALPGASNGWNVVAPVSRYWARLVAVNAAGRSAPSNELFIDLVPRRSCGTSPPLNLVATVVNRVVTLTWELPADGSDEPPRIVAGSAPGLSDLASITAEPFSTSYSVTAPPGTYYVRLEVGCFTTAASNEVQVVVP